MPPNPCGRMVGIRHQCHARRCSHVANQPGWFSTLISTFIITMHYLRKSNPSTDSPPPTPSPGVKDVQELASRRNPKTLGATSSVIALSISSAFRDLSDASCDGSTDQGNDTYWQAACATIRMAVEITKESSDLCTPLKAVVGAISVLIKNYDVSAACTLSGCHLTLCSFPVSASGQ